MNSPRSNRSGSRKRNYTVINIESAEQLQEERKELRGIMIAEKNIIRTLAGLRYEKKKVEDKIAQLEKKIRNSKISGGTKRLRFRNNNGSAVHDVRTYEINESPKKRMRNYSSKRHSPRSEKAEQKWQKAMSGEETEPGPRIETKYHGMNMDDDEPEQNNIGRQMSELLRRRG
jgi:hypothetical protein